MGGSRRQSVNASAKGGFVLFLFCFALLPGESAMAMEGWACSWIPLEVNGDSAKASEVTGLRLHGGKLWEARRRPRGSRGVKEGQRGGRIRQFDQHGSVVFSGHVKCES
jgi:hypothetical protein